jgi:hypothetical protein
MLRCWTSDLANTQHFLQVKYNHPIDDVLCLRHRSHIQEIGLDYRETHQIGLKTSVQIKGNISLPSSFAERCVLAFLH